ncbi:MAG: pknB 1 [Verrucomicrobia bacterium]|nr:pknB 1 [Verrucomicrobiota bacterium]
MTLCPACGFDFDPMTHRGVCPRCSLAHALSGSHVGALGGDYELLNEVGRGAMGIVWLARQRSLDRLVALKVIALGTRPVDWLEARLLREARASAQLSHPHIVAVHEVGRNESGAFLAMEYCDGGNLRDHLRQQPLSPRDAAELVGHLADAVAHAHAAGVLHRDLKPSNILLNSEGAAKISDFGLATAASGGGGELTVTGEVAGSPSYLAPESLRANVAPAPALDVYGLGTILYEGVTGRPPFVGDSAASVLSQVSSVEPVAPRVLNRTVPADLETIILKCLEKNPSARYASAADVRDDLGRFLEGHPIHARPISPIGRAVRWAKRSPALAVTTLLAAGLLIAVASVSTLAAFRLQHEKLATAEQRDRAEREKLRALSAEAAAREQLRAALLAQSKATRFSARAGQRFSALEAVKQAAAIRPAADARSEAVAALALPDWSPAIQAQAAPEKTAPHTLTPLPNFNGFIDESETGVFTFRKFPGGEVLWTWPGAGSASAGTTVVSRDGRFVAARLQNDEIHVLDAATGAHLFALAHRPFAFKPSRIWGYGTDLAFSSDGTLFAATRPEGGLTFHHLPDGAQIADWATPEWIVSVAFSHRGSLIAAGGSRERGTHVFAVLEAATGRVVKRESSGARVNFVEWSDDDRWLAVGSRPLQIRAAADLALRNVLPENNALHARFLPDGGRILTSEQVGQTRIWDIDSGRLILSKGDAGRPGVWFDSAPIRQWRYFSSGLVNLETFHDAQVMRIVRPIFAGFNLPSITDPVDVSPDGRWIVLGGWGGPVFLDRVTEKWLRPPPEGPTDSASTARFDVTGKVLWVGHARGALRRHDVSMDGNGQLSLSPGEVVDGHDNFLPAAFCPSTGALALSNFVGGRYQIFDPRTRTVLSEWAMPHASFATFSPDGKYLLATADPGIGSHSELREVTTGKLVRAIAEHGSQSGAWSPDGRWALAADGPGHAYIWKTADWTPGPVLPVDLQGNGCRATYSPDSRILAVNDNDGIVLVRSDTAEELVALNPPERIRFTPSLKYTPDGKTLIAARLDGSVCLWSIDAVREELGKLGLDWKD